MAQRNEQSVSNSEAAAAQEQAKDKEAANKSVQDQMSHLTAAKDRAQMSQASAMSILDVKVLVDLIKGGSGYSMFVPLLVLVILALVLQVAVGFLSLMISNIKSRFEKFRMSASGACCCVGSSQGDDEDPAETKRRREALADAGVFKIQMSKEKTFDDRRAEYRILPQDGGYETVRIEKTDSMKISSETPRPVRPTLADIYGQAPARHGSAVHHIPTPYDTPDARTKEPKSMKAKARTRLQAWLDQMMESKETEIEIKINISFLEGEISRSKEKLKQLQQTAAEHEQNETTLATDWQAAKAEWEKVIEEKLKVENEIRFLSDEVEKSRELEARKLEVVGLKNAEEKAKAQMQSKLDEGATADELGVFDMERKTFEQRRADAEAELMLCLESLKLRARSTQDDACGAGDSKIRDKELFEQLEKSTQRFPLLEAEEIHAREKLHSIESARKKARETRADIERVELEIKTATDEKEKQQKGIRQFKMDDGRFRLYKQLAEEIEQRKTLERVMFWQNIINYILYVVFVLNSFIATLSLV